MSGTKHGPILLVGGTGVFGSRLAEGLGRDGVENVLLAGRQRSRLVDVAGRLGQSWLEIDVTRDNLEQRLNDISPFAVIDASGPFQSYGHADPYRLARAAIAVGAHYLDLSDDAEFTDGLKTLDLSAKANGVTALSGASSVPAISAAAARDLAKGLTKVDLIESMILPGNRAPRGRSVMAAILAQAGKPIPGSDRNGWIGIRKVAFKEAGIPAFIRLASPIGAPDLLLFPHHFGALKVRFLAGLEMRFLHRALGLIAWLVERGRLKSAVPLLPVLWPLARLFQPFGTDVGAMRVLVRGQATDGAVREKSWVLLAGAGDGPHVPAIPGRILVRRLLSGKLKPGARACIEEFSLTECESAAPERDLSFRRFEREFHPIFCEALGPDFALLPKQVRDLHDVVGSRLWEGQAVIEVSQTWLGRTIARVFRFPSTTTGTPVRVNVTMDREDDCEVWTRRFGDHVFRSHLTNDPQTKRRVWERFGWFNFAIDLKPTPVGLEYPVKAGRLFSIPIPKALLPISRTRETVDTESRVTFDVALSLPLVGRIVGYRGWLVEAQPMNGDQELPAS